MIKPLKLTGRCVNGAEHDNGTLYHAVECGDRHYVEFETAICGAKPGKRSNGWSPYIGENVTCQRCLKKLEPKTDKIAEYIKSWSKV